MIKSGFTLARTAAAVLAGGIGLAAIVAGPARADVFSYNVDIPTDSLITNSGSGPFTMVVTLTDGNSTGDGNNTVTLTNFNVAGPPSSISLTDNSPSVFTQSPFTVASGPGSTLDFILTTTNNIDITRPDEFGFFIYDGATPTPNPVPTTDPGSALFYIDLGGFTPSVTTFQGTHPYEGLNATLTTVPEPSTTIPLAIALTGLAGLIVTRKRNRAGN